MLCSGETDKLVDTLAGMIVEHIKAAGKVSASEQGDQVGSQAHDSGTSGKRAKEDRLNDRQRRILERIDIRDRKGDQWIRDVDTAATPARQRPHPTAKRIPPRAPSPEQRQAKPSAAASIR